MMFRIPFWGVPVREMQISGAIPVAPGFYGFHPGTPTGTPGRVRQPVPGGVGEGFWYFGILSIYTDKTSYHQPTTDKTPTRSTARRGSADLL